MSVNDLTERDERPPYVRFETRSIEDKRESLSQGRYISKDVDFALITPPYSKDCIEMKVGRWLENQERHVKNGRIPAEWLKRWKQAYQAFVEGNEIPENGTPIRDWGSISPAQREMIIRSGIRTIEDLAGCNDEGLRRLGMGGRDLVNKAKSWLKSVNDYGKVSMQNAALEKENEQLQITVASLEEKVEALSKMVKTEKESKSYESTYEQKPVEVITAADILDDEPSLQEQYREKFGKAPHWKMKDETIRQKLEE
ncbi:MAG: hypothetical protein KJO69_09980 [Gammaproteobacteria bacterium]|nr:hypothetical protein [Gammaproteobacteria bacterium]